MTNVGSQRKIFLCVTYVQLYSVTLCYKPITLGHSMKLGHDLITACKWLLMIIIILSNRIGNAVYLLKWIKNHVQDRAINICFFYDIACVLDTHLRVKFFLQFYFNWNLGRGTLVFLLVKRLLYCFICTLEYALGNIARKCYSCDTSISLLWTQSFLSGILKDMPIEYFWGVNSYCRTHASLLQSS